MERPDHTTGSSASGVNASVGTDSARHSSARICDYVLGGSYNLAVDREVAHLALEAMPDLAIQAQINRAFLHRAVRRLARAGVRQFLDLGSGIPDRGAVHEAVRLENAGSQVVYVDNDPAVVRHGQQILLGNPRAVMIEEDIRRPETLLARLRADRLLDLRQPVAVLLLAVLHGFPDDHEVFHVTSELRAALAPGSYVVIAHLTMESRPDDWERLLHMCREIGSSVTPRPYATVERLFAGLELIDPGVVWAPLWNPEHPDDVDDDPGRSSNLVGVGRVR